MFPVSYSWFSIVFLLVSAVYAYFADPRNRARDVVVWSIIVQFVTLALAHNESLPIIHLAAYSSTLEAFFAYTIWNEKRYWLRKPYTALLMATTIITMLWGIDSIVETGLLYNAVEPSIYTLVCTVLTAVQGVVLILGARGKHERGRIGNTFFIRFLSFFDSSLVKSDEK